MIPIDHYMRNQRTDTTVAYVFRNKKESRCCFATCRAPALAAAGAKALACLMHGDELSAG